MASTRFAQLRAQQHIVSCIIRLVLFAASLKGVDTSRGLADLAGRYYSRFFLHRMVIPIDRRLPGKRERELFAISVLYLNKERNSQLLCCTYTNLNGSRLVLQT